MKEKKYLKLNDIDAYKLAFHLSNYVWKVVMEWDYFAKKTIGAQFVDAADSISANIAEGYGRYHKKDKIKFYRYSQGSIKECYDWNEKAKIRKLVNEEEYQYIFRKLEEVSPALNRWINYTNTRLKILKKLRIVIV
jgi:four helix bundle protein